MSGGWLRGAVLALCVFVMPMQDVWAGEKVTYEDLCELYIRQQGSKLKTAEAQAVQASMVDFGLSLHEEMAAGRRGESTITSPFSIMSMLGLLYNGTSSTTAAEMQRELRLGSTTLDEFNRGMLEVGSSLRQVEKDVILAYGNLTAIDTRYIYARGYRERVERFFGALADRRDFSQVDQLITDFNQYISDNTNGMIPNLLTPDDAPDGWALINAGYFKAAWAVIFDKENTRIQDFKLGGGKKKPMPMMHAKSPTYPHFANDEVEMVSIPYARAEFAMDIILPRLNENEDPLDAVYRAGKQFTGAKYMQWVEGLKPMEFGSLELPRWESRTELREEFKAALQRRMPELFSSSARIDKIFEAGNGPPLGQAVHATKIRTTELGSDGAFVTFGGGMESMPTNFRANRPFLAIIRHLPTQTPLFVMTEVNPTAIDDEEDAEGAKQSEPVAQDTGGITTDPSADVSEPNLDGLEPLLPRDDDDEGGPEVMVVKPLNPVGNVRPPKEGSPEYFIFSDASTILASLFETPKELLAVVQVYEGVTSQQIEEQNPYLDLAPDARTTQQWTEATLYYLKKHGKGHKLVGKLADMAKNDHFGEPLRRVLVEHAALFISRYLKHPGE